jgi:exosortase A
VKSTPQIALQPATTPRSATARASVAAIIVIAYLLALYRETAWSMVSTWLRSETFTHGFIVAPIAIWLMWLQRHEVAAVGIAPTLWLAWIVGLGGVAWLLGTLAIVQVVAQFALVVMIQATIVAMFGVAASRHLLFPIAFLFFAVPFGEFMMPWMMVWTAEFTVAALKLTGIPVYQEGLYFVIPSGAWSVEQACSGVRYLIASVMIGCLFVHLFYRSTGRRVAFLLASVIVPIIANWMRAYMIVMIGHLSGNRLAVGVDHLIYGWIFFGFVMLLLFWIGARWREDFDEQPKPVLPPRANSRSTRGPALNRIVMVAVVVLAIGSAWPLAYALIVGATPLTFPALAKVEPQAGWLPGIEPFSSWKPDYVSPRAETMQYYSKGSYKVGLYIAYYSGQEQRIKLISSTNRLVPPEGKEWIVKKSGSIAVDVGQTQLPVLSALVGTTNRNLAVWHWYWVDGRWTASDYVTKLLLVRSRLLGRGDDAAAVFVFTPVDSQMVQGEETLREFLTDMLPSIKKALDESRGQ